MIIRAILALAALLASVPLDAWAQGAWKPERNVEILVGTSPGGSIDRVARLAQRILSEKGWLPSSSVANRAGGGGAIAYQHMNQNPGGHHIAIGSLTMITNNVAGKSDIGHADVTPLALLVSEYVTFSVRSEAAIKTPGDLIERLRKDPASASFAVASALGGSNHIAGGMVLKGAGADPKKGRFVVFNSSGDSMTAVLGGHVDVLATSASTAIPQIQAGKLRMLAVAAPRRLAGAVAGVPTWRELGTDAVFSNWFAAIGPGRMTSAQVAYYDELFAKMVKTPEWQSSLEKFVWENDYLPSRQSRRFYEDQHNAVKAILPDLGVLK